MNGNINISNATFDAYYTVNRKLFKNDYDDLIKELSIFNESNNLLSDNYKREVFNPFIEYLSELGRDVFNSLFSRNDLSLSERKTRNLIEDIAESFLQRTHEGRYYKSSFNALLALQALVAAFHQNLDANKPLMEIFKEQKLVNKLPPLVKWGNSRICTRTVQKSTLKLSDARKILFPGFVNFPAEFRTGGLLVWTSIAHEVGGHHTLQSHPDLIPNLRKKVDDYLILILPKGNKYKNEIISYWKSCTEEIACDVLGVLTMGPSFALGLMGYLQASGREELNSWRWPLHQEKRTVNSLYLKVNQGSDPFFINELGENVTIKGREGQFSSDTTYEHINFPAGKHPHPVLRLLAVAYCVSCIVKESPIPCLIIQEVNKIVGDSETIYFYTIKKDLPASSTVLQKDGQHNGSRFLKKTKLSLNCAKQCVESVVNAILYSSLPCLKDNFLPDLINWKEEDQNLVKYFQTIIKQRSDNSGLYGVNTLYSRHIVAAAVLESIEASANIEEIFNTMISLLIAEYWRHPDLNKGVVVN